MIEAMHLKTKNVVHHMFEPFGRNAGHILSPFLLVSRGLHGTAYTAHRDL